MTHPILGAADVRGLLYPPDNDADPLLWAFFYAHRGWLVIPLHTPIFRADTSVGCSCGDRECRSIGKHPRIRNAAHLATADPGQIREWWRMWPDANVGLLCGPSFAVLDIDDFGAMVELSEAHPGTPMLAQAPTVYTARGFHLYFKPFGTNQALVGGKKVDWIAHSKYVVAPPSLRVDGEKYAWGDDLAGPDALVPEAPPWVKTLLGTTSSTAVTPAANQERSMPTGLEDLLKPEPIANPRAYAVGALRNMARQIAQTPEGGRNDVLNRHAFHLFKNFCGNGKLDPGEIAGALTAAATHAGLGEREIENTIRSAARKARNG